MLYGVLGMEDWGFLNTSMNSKNNLLAAKGIRYGKPFPTTDDPEWQ